MKPRIVQRKWSIAVGTAFLVGVLACVRLAGQDEAPAADKVVSVEGFAACTGESIRACRQAALADALRRAVEKACGVLVEADTQTKNYVPVQDVVRTSSEGYVRDYRILEEGRQGETYRIKLDARVAPGSPVKSLKHLCQRLKESRDPLFGLTVQPEDAQRAIAGELAALGLRVSGNGTEKPPDIAIEGTVGVDPIGEAVAGSGIFTAGASASLSVTENESHAMLPSVNVLLPQPVPAVSQARANKEAVEAASMLWVERNLPLVITALLDPGAIPETENRRISERGFNIQGPEFKVEPTPNTQHPTPEYGNPQSAIRNPQSRVIVDPEALVKLADKLKQAIREKSEFASLPAEIAIARFKLIGVDDPGAAEDVLEDLSTALVKTGVFELVERGQLDKVLSELRLQNSGLIDSSTAKKLGKLVGAKAVLIGSISDRKDCIVINARLINTESGRVRIAESVVVDKERGPRVLRAG